MWGFSPAANQPDNYIPLYIKHLTGDASWHGACS